MPSTKAAPALLLRYNSNAWLDSQPSVCNGPHTARSAALHSLQEHAVLIMQLSLLKHYSHPFETDATEGKVAVAGGQSLTWEVTGLSCTATPVCRGASHFRRSDEAPPAGPPPRSIAGHEVPCCSHAGVPTADCQVNSNSSTVADHCCIDVQVPNAKFKGWPPPAAAWHVVFCVPANLHYFQVTSADCLWAGKMCWARGSALMTCCMAGRA